MAEKIGELLVKEGFITQSELEEALRSQVIYGGKLGTNLIEMGLLSEEDFGRVLSRMLKVPYFSANDLRDIPQAVIESLPAELAAKYKVIPLRLENRRLTLVMTDPSDLRTLDEISFRTGMLIRPAISSEMGMVHALEKYYDVPREIRYISLSRNVPMRQKAAAMPVDPPAPPAAVPIQAPSRTAATAAAVAPAKPVMPPSSPPTAKPIAPAAPAAVTVEKKPAPVTSPVAAPSATAPAKPVPAPSVLLMSSVEAAPEPPPIDIFASVSPAEGIAPVTLETVAQRLVESVDREDIADAAISWLGGQFHRSALFLVRGEFATGWHAVSGGNAVCNFDRLRIPLTEPSALKTVADSRSPILGPLQRTPYNSMLLQELGGVIPKTALLLPLLMLGRITAILYLDGPDNLLQEKMPEVQKLGAKMIMAFEILMLKNKILSL